MKLCQKLVCFFETELTLNITSTVLIDLQDKSLQAIRDPREMNAAKL